MTPFDVVDERATVTSAGRAELLKIVRLLEVEALAEPPDTGYGVLQDARLLTPTTARIWSRLAQAGTRSTLLAHGLVSDPAPDVLGVPLAEDDPLTDEWVVLFRGPAPVVLAAKDLPYERWDRDRTFTYGISRRPEVVELAEQTLVRRVAAHREAAGADQLVDGGSSGR